MYNGNKLFLSFAIIMIFMLSVSPSIALDITSEEMAEIRACDCKTLSTDYKEFIDAEKEIEQQIKKNNQNTAATNAVGVATLAVVGIGFFSWGDENEEPKQQLEDLRTYRKAIEVVAKEKNCALPVASASISAINQKK